MDLTDAQWAVLHPLLPRPRIRRDRRGRPWRDPRDVLNGILWILRTGAPWADLPVRYPSPKTCHRRFQHWRADGTLEAVLRALGAGFGGTRAARSLRMLHRRHLRGGENWGSCVGPTRRGKGTKIMAVADGAGLPLSVSIASASPNEVTLLDAALDALLTEGTPAHLIGDKAYDSDALGARLRQERRIEMIAPHRRRRRRPRTQDGRALRRYRRRWKIERLFAWLHNFRRLVTRYERHAANFLAFVQLGCIMILLRSFVR